MEFNNWNKERERLKAEIFKELREQKDRKSLTDATGELNIQVQQLKAGEHAVIGPISFKTSFRGRPKLSLDQALYDTAFPFCVILYRHSWHMKQGTVDGFYLGLYAVTAPPAGLIKHVINWRAVGTATLYRHQERYESWQMSYDNEKAHHLED